uniref:Uncharacterized protein n=1 Tax=Setaria viridis TaxID=4556 RepID=A0A4U6UEL3_SETVI|nr:hypothetical protein SEVIR_5G040700v2 [Setaria viridis]
MHQISKVKKGVTSQRCLRCKLPIKLVTPHLHPPNNSLEIPPSSNKNGKQKRITEGIKKRFSGINVAKRANSRGSGCDAKTNRTAKPQNLEP